jgi:hypothetical protein
MSDLEITSLAAQLLKQYGPQAAWLEALSRYREAASRGDPEASARWLSVSAAIQQMTAI